MEIRWLGDRCFVITAATGTLVTDPLPASGPTPDMDPASVVVAISRPDAGPGAGAWSERFRVIEGPGEYEISGLGIRGIATPVGDASDPRALNTVYVFDVELISVCHLGALGGPLTTQAAQLIGHVDVLITPAGGMDQAISADQAAAVARTLEPRLIIPMHPAVRATDTDFAHLDAYVGEVGLAKPEPLPRLTVTRGNIGDAQRLVLLRPQGPA